MRARWVITPNNKSAVQAIDASTLLSTTDTPSSPIEEDWTWRDMGAPSHQTPSMSVRRRNGRHVAQVSPQMLDNPVDRNGSNGAVVLPDPCATWIRTVPIHAKQGHVLRYLHTDGSSGGGTLSAAADRMLEALCARHVNHDPACCGVLRDGKIGDGTLPGSRRYQARNSYTSWGDYFLMEALARRLHGLTSYW